MFRSIAKCGRWQKQLRVERSNRGLRGLAVEMEWPIWPENRAFLAAESTGLEDPI